MFLYVCKQTFCKFYGLITREFLGLKIWSFQGIIFIWTRTYSEVFKSALVSFKFVHIKTFGGVLVKSKFSKQWMCYLQAWNHTWTNLICKVFYSNMSCLCFYARWFVSFLLNSLNAKTAIIQKPVSWFAEQKDELKDEFFFIELVIYGCFCNALITDCPSNDQK